MHYFRKYKCFDLERPALLFGSLGLQLEAGLLAVLQQHSQLIMD